MSNSYRSSIPQKLEQAQARAVLVTEKTARNIEAGCETRSRVDTGQMKNGWQALQLGDLEWEVANHVEHVVYNEYGSAHPPRYYKTTITDPSRGIALAIQHYSKGYTIPAQPMLWPSVEQARPAFEAAISRIFGS